MEMDGLGVCPAKVQRYIPSLVSFSARSLCFLSFQLMHVCGNELLLALPAAACLIRYMRSL